MNGLPISEYLLDDSQLSGYDSEISADESEVSNQCELVKLM